MDVDTLDTLESGLAFSAADLAQTRFAVSPMWEVVTSYRVLTGRADPGPHRRWVAQVRPRIPRCPRCPRPSERRRGSAIGIGFGFDSDSDSDSDSARA
ncbi:hypothetical protein EAO70_13795 [Streptomyces sp. adm13(2018)]|nr:hypothetical protein EAO70_13795 [Streptomyces sp. adm13(2018)]